MSSFILSVSFLIVVTSTEMDFARKPKVLVNLQRYPCLVLLTHPKLRYQFCRPVKSHILIMKPGKLPVLSAS